MMTLRLTEKSTISFVHLEKLRPLLGQVMQVEQMSHYNLLHVVVSIL